MAMVIPVLTMHGAVAPLAVALLAASAAVQDSPRERPASLTPDVIEVAVVKRDLFVVDSRGARDPIRLFMDERVLNTVAQGRVAAVLTSQRALFFADGNLEVAEARWKMNERAAREAVLGGEVGVAKNAKRILLFDGRQARLHDLELGSAERTGQVLAYEKIACVATNERVIALAAGAGSPAEVRLDLSESVVDIDIKLNLVLVATSAQLLRYHPAENSWERLTSF